MTVVLGVSAFYHDSAAALLRDGEIVAAVQEERFTRRKNDPSFPIHAVRHCLDAAGLRPDQVDHLAFYDKPLLKFERLLETHLACAPRSLPAFVQAMPVWLKEKLFLKHLLRDHWRRLGGERIPLLSFPAHHQSHAASAFYPSPFERAAVLCLDGVGEWATTSAWRGAGRELEPLWQQDFPHSLGLLYSAFTVYCGFRVNSGEYKLMGLAPYGEPRYRDRILEELLDLKDDGSFRLDLRYFDFACGRRMTSERFHRLFGGPPRRPEGELESRHMDLAASIQAVTEEIVLRLARTLREETGERHLCLAGGVALNCVANGKLRATKLFDEIWVQPAAGDAGGALGAALAVHHGRLQAPRTPRCPDAMAGALLGPAYDETAMEKALRHAGANFERLTEDELDRRVADALAAGKVVGWFQGQAEFGPRALGDRSILGDPRPAAMQSRINQKIKFRESFRPFAPAVLADHQADWFEMTGDSPYMLFVTRLRTDRLRPVPKGVQGLDRLRHPRSEVPAVTHVDGSARVQTVRPDIHPRFHRLLSAFHARTGCPMVVNTSFNVRGEPIVLTPEDALRCFFKTDMDLLALGPFLLDKAKQPDGVTIPPPPEADSPSPIPEATPKRLRQFAVSTAVVVAILFAFFFPWLAGKGPLWSIVAGCAAWGLWGLVFPRTLTRPYRAWMAFGQRLGRLTTPLLLGFVYFTLVTPMGLALRLSGRDPLQRRTDPGAGSYRRPSDHHLNTRLEKPF